jgi:hypothetical protein
LSENISYIEDDEKVARRSILPPLAAFLAPPAFLETAQDKEERQRQQKLLDEARKKKKEDTYEEYRDNFAKDFPKGISAYYAFLSQSIITDLERTIENIIPPTTNIMHDPISCHERVPTQ